MDDYDNPISSVVFYADIESDFSKVYVDTDRYLYWNKGDTISVFRGALDEKFIFMGETGDNSGSFQKIDSKSPLSFYEQIYAMFPYDKNATCSSSGDIACSIPAVQYYSEKSVGTGSNIMFAATKGSAENHIHFRNACGYLLLRIYGGDLISRIQLVGNDGEKISGEATAHISTDECQLSVTGESAEGITLECGDIPTGETKDDATEFWIVVPPMTFQKGFSVTVTNSVGTKKTFVKESATQIKRNSVKQMSPVEMSFSTSHEFTSFGVTVGGKHFDAHDLSDTLITVYVDRNDYDLSSVVADFSFMGEGVYVGETKQISGVTPNDFTSSVRYAVQSLDGEKGYYTIRIEHISLPRIVIETPGRCPIDSKTVWIDGATISVYYPDGTFEPWGTMSIKGRGNSTWYCSKKPYAIKLDQKRDCFGMHKSKRWVLLANAYDRTQVRNEIAFEICRRCRSLEWNPDGQFADLIINGTYLGFYDFREKIKVEKGRVNIHELTAEDVDISGGYLLEIDARYDEQYKFKTSLLNLPVQLQGPDENVPDVQIDYIKQYMEELEAIVTDNTRLLNREYLNYIDVDTFIDWFIVNELTGTIECTVPYGAFCYKDQGGKLKMGPLWDFDARTFVPMSGWRLKGKNTLWFDYLFTDPYFVERFKYKWNESKSDFEDVVNYMDKVFDEVYDYVVINAEMWETSHVNGDEDLPIKDADARMRSCYLQRISQLDKLINSL